MAYVPILDYNPPTLGNPRRLYSPQLFDSNNGTYPISPLPSIATYPADIVTGRIPFYQGSQPSCLPAGIMIRILGGEKPIEQIQVGDTIAGYAEDTLEPLHSKVIETFVWYDKQMCDLITEEGIIRTSIDHKIYRKLDKTWIPTRNFQPGDITLWEIDGKLVETKVKKISLRIEKETIYNLAMEKGHIYVGGTLPAHNKTETCAGTCAPTCINTCAPTCAHTCFGCPPMTHACH
jgi:hypothetical protein